MENNHQQEISQPDQPEIDHKTIPEFDQSTEHPQGDQTQIQSEILRYENADELYKVVKP